MYLEFKNVPPVYGSPDEIYTQYGVLITDPHDMRQAALVMLATLVVFRVLCFLAVKFAFTGRPWAENMRD